jgi:hypothetical protein
MVVILVYQHCKYPLCVYMRNKQPKMSEITRFKIRITHEAVLPKNSLTAEIICSIFDSCHSKISCHIDIASYHLKVRL